MRTASLLASALVLVSCAQKGAGASDAGPAASGGRHGPGLQYAVDVVPTQSRKVDYVVQAPGTIDAFEQVQVTARVAGIVDRVAFREGQVVKKSDLLVVIDAERYQLALAQAKAAVVKATATEDDAQKALERRQGADSKNPGLIPGEEVATYQTKLLTAKADVAAAQENVKVAEINVRDSYVRASMAGTIQTRTVATGQYVAAGYLMATLLNDNPMLLHFNVETQDAPRLKTGLTAKFTMRETQNVFTATITLVAGAADPNLHTVPVTATVDNTDHKYWLRPGSFCDVTIDVGATRDAVIVPRSAVRATDHGYVVYVVEGDVAKEKTVTLGMNTKEGQVEVRSGLAAGELLVVRGAEPLSTGAHVRARPVEAGGEADGGHGGRQRPEAGAP
jgi:RND family efflux transporter MFP subunit